MAGLKGTPSPKPASLKGPVAASNKADDIDSMLAEFEAPAAAAPAPSGTPAPAADDVDSMLAEFDGGGEAPVAAPREYSEESPSLLDPGNLMDRVRYGLAANDQSVVNTLAKRYGEDNVEQKNGKIYYRKEAGAKMRPIDPDQFELFADLVLDGGRTIVSEAAMIPGEALGFAAGTAMGAPTVVGVPAAAAGGAITGRVASVPFANATADTVAELAGVVPDQNRDVFSENLWAMAAETAFPLVGNKVSKFIPGTAAYKASRAANAKETVALSNASKQVLRAADELEADGINLSMTLDQIQPNDPSILKMSQEAASDPRFLNKQMQFAEGYGEVLDNTISEIKRRALPDGQQVPQAKLAEYVTDSVKALDRAEGKVIGEYKTQAMRQLKGQKIPLPDDVRQNVTNMLREFGFRPGQQTDAIIQRRTVPDLAGDPTQLYKNIDVKKQTWRPPTLSDMRKKVIGKGGIKSTGEARALINNLQDLSSYLENGATLEQLEQLVTKTGDLHSTLRGKPMDSAWAGVTGSLRQHRRDIIGSTLPDDAAKKLFNQRMDEFKVMKENIGDLKAVLNSDVSAKAIVSKLFNGQENFHRVQAIKGLVGKNSPEWGNLKAEFMDQLLLNHADKTSLTGFNSEKFMDTVEKKYGKQFLTEVLDDPKDVKTLTNLLTVGRRIEETIKVPKTEGTNKAVEAAADLMVGAVGGVKFKILNGMQKLFKATGDKENPIFEHFNRYGYEQYVAKLKNADKGAVSKSIEAMMNTYNRGRANSRDWAGSEEIAKRIAGKTILKTQDGLKRAPRAMTREEVSRDD
jgi:hypothetical protein